MKASLLSLLLLAATAGLFNTSTVFAKNACEATFAEARHREPAPAPIYLRAKSAKVASPESLPTVAKMNRTLDAYIKVATHGKDLRSQIFRAALPRLTAIRALGASLNAASSQKAIFNFTMNFSRLVDLPNAVADTVGYYADGFDTVHHYNEAAMKERLEGLAYRYSDPNGIFADIIAAKVKALNQRFEFGLESSFPSISINGDEIPERKFSVQYTYVMKEGLLTLRDLIKDRESGLFYLGVSRVAHTIYDGQWGNSVAFVSHDAIHAFVQKHYDAVLFEKYGAKSFADAKRMKTITNRLLTERLKELDQLGHPKLQQSAELVLFALLHEQALTYPVGTHDEMSKKDRKDFYVGNITEFINAGEFGPEYAGLIGHPELLQSAWDWVASGAARDTHVFETSVN